MHSVQGTHTALLLLLRRLHFYIGLFIGPFIFIAALTGTLYVVTPSVETAVYQSSLKIEPHGTRQRLADQIAVARHYVGEQARITALRPAPEADDTTRVMFTQAGLGPSESRAIFIDPYRLTVKGDLTVYGTSGILPLRTWLDHLHQSLLLGPIGRAYSELAASWMWLVALSGVVLWAQQHRARRPLNSQSSKGVRYQRWHRRLGLVLLLGMLFLSVTGITWSQWAGENVNRLRQSFDWLTPQLTTSLSGKAPAAMASAHAEHDSSAMVAMPGMDMGNSVSLPTAARRVANQDWDKVLGTARQAGIQASRVEIRPPKNADQAWTVTEIDHRWPVQVDAVAVDPHQFTVIDQVVFNDFPLVAKLTRWGVDAHMGILFGGLNQLLLALFGIGLCTLIVLGYRLWWQRRPAQDKHHPVQTLTACWRQCSGLIRSLTLVLAAAIGYALPLLGISLIGFILIDIVRWKETEQKMKQSTTPALSLEQQQRNKYKRNFICGIVVIWLVISVVMTKAIIGGVIDEYHIPLERWTFSMYLMQGMMILLYTSVFTAFLSVPLWYFFLGKSDPQGE